MKTIILNWAGPYFLEEVLENKQLGNGLYLVTGKIPYERVSKIQYCGITERLFANRLYKHHKINDITKDRKIWLAQIEYPHNVTREILEAAEKMLIWTWQLPLNEKKKVSLPTSPTTILHFWFKKDRKNVRKNQIGIFRDFSDVLSWDGKYWRSANLKVEEY